MRKIILLSFIAVMVLSGLIARAITTSDAFSYCRISDTFRQSSLMQRRFDRKRWRQPDDRFPIKDAAKEMESVFPVSNCGPLSVLHAQNRFLASETSRLAECTAILITIL